MYRYPEPTTVDKVMKLLSHYQGLNTGYDIIFKQVAASSIPDMRGAMVESMLSVKEVSHLLLIDDDMNFPVGMGYGDDGEELSAFNPLERLMNQDKDIVGALCFSRNRSVIPFVGSETDDGLCLNVQDRDVIKSGELFQVDFIGFGMVLIKRRVIDRVMMANGIRPGGNIASMFHSATNWRYEIDARQTWEAALDKYEKDVMSKVGADRGAARNRLANAVDFIQMRSQRLLDDYSFCRRARKAGCEIWCDPSFDVTHIGRYEYGRMDWLAIDAVKSETEGVLQE